MKKIAAIVIAIVIVVAAFLLLSGKSSSTPKQPCSQGSKPCIALINSKGVEIATFNNFQFCGNNCVSYEDIHNNWITYRGTYNLKWIGPVPVRNAGAAKI